MPPLPPHFEISAAVVRQLGDELVSDEVTAIVELVKNAYDADATFAHVTVNTTGELEGQGTAFPGVKGYITIDDDGMGMDRSDVERGWLFISLSNKRVMKSKGETTPKGRTPLGDKGLGRLSTQKLGHNLEMLTRKDSAKTALHVSFSWRAFSDDKSLSTVPVTIEEISDERVKKKGTLLAISDLRDPNVWRGSSVEKLVADLSQIISPFAEARPFLVTLNIDGKPVDLGHISELTRKAAVGRFQIEYENGRLNLHGKVRLAKFRGNQRDAELEFFETDVIPDNGRDFFDFLSSRKSPPANLTYSDDPAYFFEFEYDVDLAGLGEIASVPNLGGAEENQSSVADPGPFHAEIDEFLLRADESSLDLSGLSRNSELQAIIKNHVGIKVFRDGFAVKPYGMNGEDWLRLGAQQTSAGSYYGLRPQNVIGYVAISEKANGRLKDKTDREGFVSDAYSRNFAILMQRATKAIADVYEWTRRNYNTYRAERMSKGQPFESGKQIVADAAKASRALADYSRRAKSIESGATKARQKMEAVSERIKSEPLLTSGGERQLTDLFNEALEAFNQSRALALELQNFAPDAERVGAMVATLGPRLDLLDQQLQDFAELAGLGLLAEALSHEILNQTDRIMQKASSASSKARRTTPQNTDLLVFAQEITASASALRRQIGHLAPSLRVRRDKIETFRISEIISNAREHFAERWTDENIELVIGNTSGDFEVRTNRGRLTQVVDNLILNSEYWLKAAREKDAPSEIHVEYTSPRLRFWDTGRGVDLAVENNLFEPFVTLKPKEKGRGLGLFIASQILESMGCSIVLLNKRNPSGRRYIFELDFAGILHE